MLVAAVSGWMTDAEKSERTRKERVVVYSSHYFGMYLGGTKERA
jgi:hypothetical protein